MDTLAEGKQKYPMILLKLNDYCGFVFVSIFFFLQILICNPHVIGNIYRTIPLILMASLTTVTVTILAQIQVSSGIPDVWLFISNHKPDEPQ